MAEVAGEVKLLLTVDGTTWSAAIDRAQREIDKLKGKTTDAARVTRAEMTEARHAIHLLGDEVGIHLPRALQGFVAKLPGVAEAMSAAFSAVAVIGLGMVIIETGKKVYEFIEKTKKAAAEAERATKEFSESRHLANLEMEAATAKIDEQIAKLEKKPGDGLKTALAEARVEAFKLGQQLEKDVEAAHKLIEEKLSANMFERVALGVAGSEDTLSKLDEYGAKVEEITKILDPAKRTDELKKYTGDMLNTIHEEITASEKLQATREAMMKQAAAGPSRTATDIRGAAPEDQTKVLRGLKLFHDMVQEQYDSAADTADQMAAQSRLKQLEGDKEREDLAKAAAEALKRQTAERMTAMETDLANQKTMHLMTIEEERDFWKKRQYVGTNLADPINAEIGKKMAPLSQAMFKQAEEEKQRWVAMIAELQKEADKLTDKENPFALDRAQMRDQGSTEAARMAALHDRPELLRQITAAQEELNASEAVSSGLMRSQTAEILKQADTVARLQDELTELQGKAAAVAAMPSSMWTPTMNPEALENQIMAKKAEVDAATKTLTYEKERDTFSGEMHAMFQDWIRSATDLRSAMTAVFDQAMGAINNALIKTMVDPYHRGDWKAAGKSIFTSVASKGLSAAEGYLMKAAKLGTAENPMYVRYADTSSVKSATAGSAVGKVLGALASSLPFMAAGGSLEAGMPAIVGERGPELFIPSGSGRIVPSDRFGGTSHVWNIDARGAGDPVAVRFQVQQAILAAAPRIAAGSIAASRDMDSRRPMMAR